MQEIITIIVDEMYQTLSDFFHTLKLNQCPKLRDPYKNIDLIFLRLIKSSDAVICVT